MTVTSVVFDDAATWLGRDNPDESSEPGQQAPAPLLRRRFRLAGRPERAVLMIAALGYFEAMINGEGIWDALLEPPLAQYDTSAFARTIDVSHLLREGENVLAVMLGRAFVSGVGSAGSSWASEPRLLAQLDVTLADGQQQRIVSDGNWRTADGPVRDWMFFGEQHDARADETGWTAVDFDDSAWVPAPQHPDLVRDVVHTSMPSVTLADTFGPVRSMVTSGGTTVFDFGRITAGWARIEVEGERGVTLTLTYGQSLNDDGSVYTWMPGMHVDSYTLRGESTESWEPRFTRHGFQYVEVAVTGGRAGLQRIEARENYTALARTGEFDSSSALLNRIHQNQSRSLLLNHWGFPTDTSWRDRQGWTADTALFMDGAILNFADAGSVYETHLRVLRDAQLPDGTVSIYAPDGREYPVSNDPSWSGMVVMIPWTLFQHYGERRYLEDNYRAMTRWMDLMDATIAATDDLHQGFSFGDHSSPGSEDAGTIDLSPREGSDITRNAHLYLQARTLAGIARLLDQPQDAARYDAMAGRIAPAFNRAYFDPEGCEYRGPAQREYRQTSNLAPLAWGLVPQQHIQAVFDRLVVDLEARGDRLNTGAIGTKLLLPVLTEHGRGDLAYRIASQTEYPSWGYWVRQGANTSWETWSHRGSEQTFDHPFLGTVEDWLFQHLAGIQPAEPGYAEILVAPVIPEGLEYASASVTTPRGLVSSSWQRNDRSITVKVQTPAGAPTRVRVPGPAEDVEIVSGEAELVTSSRESSTYRIGTRDIHLRIGGIC